MKAKIKELNNKYYGTIIDIIIDNGQKTEMCIWVNTGSPSKREIEKWGYTQSDWDNNIEIEDGWGGKEKIKESDYICNNHYESDESYKIAKIIVNAINQN